MVFPIIERAKPTLTLDEVDAIYRPGPTSTKVCVRGRFLARAAVSVRIPRAPKRAQAIGLTAQSTFIAVALLAFTVGNSIV